MTPGYPLSSPFRGRFSKPCSRGKVVGQYGPCCMELGGHWRRENTTGSDLKSDITLGLEKGPGGHVGEPTQCLRESRAGGCPAARKRIKDGGQPSIHCLSFQPRRGEVDSPCNRGDWSWKAVIKHSNHSVTLAVAA